MPNLPSRFDQKVQTMNAAVSVARGNRVSFGRGKLPVVLSPVGRRPFGGRLRARAPNEAPPTPARCAASRPARSSFGSPSRACRVRCAPRGRRGGRQLLLPGSHQASSLRRAASRSERVATANREGLARLLPRASAWPCLRTTGHAGSRRKPRRARVRSRRAERRAP